VSVDDLRENRIQAVPGVDSCTFLALFGLFIAQLTGSFVAAGAQIARLARS
jgi:hypothetical protein